ncbi:MAG TPA: single-stranded-DNA-specific exonuclease RecJ [Thermoleophilaceae bacterium]|nr:single-stranded-DNA-specific exonuclease RecJ [Thermoleophilaceae bacterium]
MSDRPSRWVAPPYSVGRAVRLSDELGLPLEVATVLARRGFEAPEEAREFMAAERREDPAALPGAPEACELILKHVGRGSPIVVHGDYDVDGVCSTALAVETLRALGASPRWRLPSRSEGYGLSRETVREVAAQGAGLLITVDCGVTAVEEVAAARDAGLDVLVTDHHRPGDQLPDCPLVHPALGSFGTPELCAAGVALKLSEALFSAAGRDPREAEAGLDLAALATVCDLVPLRGENRRIVREGLAAMARSPRVGLRALMKVSALDPAELSAQALGFRLGPRINAAGRLSRADAPLELMLCREPERADEIAQELDGLNHDRREAETRILFAAEAAASAHANRAAMVVAGEGWHPGVVGIVASRLVERWHRPCVVAAIAEDGTVKGSGRSISAYDLHAGLGACAPLLIRFGGHRMAAGVELRADSLPAFADALAEHAAAALTPADLIPEERVDAVLPAGALGLELAEAMEALGPFGMGNPQPTLLVPSARVESVTGMGSERQHARFTLTSGGARARAVAFGSTPRSLEACTGEGPCDVAFRLERNRWNGVVEPRVLLRAVGPSRAGSVRSLDDEEPLWEAIDHELSADPSLPWPAPGAPTRAVLDRRGRGVAGVAGDLLSSGEPTLVVCADVARRRAGLEQLVAGMAPGGCLDAVSLDRLARSPALAEGYTHLVALDPPLARGGRDLLAAVPARGFVHLAWGAPEWEFALAVWRAGLDLRPALAAVYRALRETGACRGAELERLLRGDGAHPRAAGTCGRVVRVLTELSLVEVEDGPEPLLRVTDASRTELERSGAYRAYAARLEGLSAGIAAAVPGRAA